MLFVYRIETAPNRTERLFVRLHVDGEMLVAVDRL
jgi:hypothetical protein